MAVYNFPETSMILREICLGPEAFYCDQAICGLGISVPRFNFTDEELADEILAALKGKEYVVSVYIHALVQSRAFRME